MVKSNNYCWCIIFVGALVLEKGISFLNRPNIIIGADRIRRISRGEHSTVTLHQSSIAVIENITQKAIDISLLGYEGAGNVAIINPSPNTKEFVPASIIDSSPKQKWTWYQQRNIYEERLKNAIKDNEVYIF